MQELVSAEWLRGEIGAPDLVVFDATYYLPNEPQDARALFAQAHVPGARFFDVNEVADPETNLPHMAPTPAVPSGCWASSASAMTAASCSTTRRASSRPRAAGGCCGSSGMRRWRCWMGPAQVARGRRAAGERRGPAPRRGTSGPISWPAAWPASAT
ncbi:hypothetical protein ACFQU7_03175 [Pseudoroseomonas wenyumeiae]